MAGKIAFASSSSEVTEAQLAQSFYNLYYTSATFRSMVDETIQRGEDVLIQLVDGTATPITDPHYPYDPNAYAHTVDTDVSAPNSSTIQISHQFLQEIDYYTTYGSTSQAQTLERVLAHEFTHSWQDAKNIAQDEEQAAQIENHIMKEAYGEAARQGDPLSAHPTYDDSATSVTPHSIQTHSDATPDRPLPAEIEEVRTLTGSAASASSPLIFDLDDSGTIELTSLANSTTYWDIDNDNFAEKSGWVTGGDGLLAIDLNSNGVIDNHAELFGTATVDGFSVLAQYDDNHDGTINASDSVFNDLIMWVDDNENGYSEETELYSLNDLDIISISLNATEVNLTNQGHHVSHTSTFVVDTGGGTDTRIVHDIWFQFDNMNTKYVGELDLDPDAMLLGADLRGYGKLPDLHIAMSLDNTGTGNLFDLVSDLTALNIGDLFDETTDLYSAVKDIMWRWANVEDVPPTSRGPDIDARDLAFLEALTGEPFYQDLAGPNPGPYAAGFLNEAISLAANSIYAHLVAQIAGGQLLEGDWHYNTATDSFEGITGLNTVVLNDLKTEASGLTTSGEREIFWDNIVRMIEYSVGTSNLSGGDQTVLNGAIYDSDHSLNLTTILGGLEWEEPVGSTYNGTSGNDTLTGGSNNDTLNGLAGADTLSGGAGNDTIYGGTNDDDYYGQAGQDYLVDGGGNDKYHYSLGDGWDTILEANTGTGNDNDRIVFGAGIDVGDLTIERYTNSGLLIHIDTGSQTGNIYIENQFNYSGGGGHVEWIEFSDTSTYDLDAQNYTLHGTDLSDTLYGVETGGGKQDTIYGGAGDDIIYAYAPNFTDSSANFLYGEAGNDTLYGGSGADTLSGGDGNDNLSGGTGNDIFLYNVGIDRFSDGGGTDEIQLAAGIVASNISYSRIGSYDLLLNISGHGSIDIADFYQNSNYKIETLRFSDNSTISLSNLYFGTSSADVFSGTSGADIMYGYGGNDTLTGNNGNDQLYGGDGNDSMYGGAGDDYMEGGNGNDYMEDTTSGNDIYVYSGGLDTIYDYTGSDVLRITGSTTVNDLNFTDLGNHHKITINSGTDEITLDWVDWDATNYKIETVEFADGFSTTLANWASWTNGTGSGETLNGGSGNDTIVGKGGNDTLNGNNGNDAMHGGTGDDILHGGSGTDLLHGGVGNDTLYGEDGLDTMFGGTGADTFVFETATAFNNQDMIKDFSATDGDKLDIHNIIDVAFNPVTDAISDFVNFTNSGSDSIMSIDRDGSGATYSFVNVATISGVADLDESTLYANGNLLAA